jgi:predicted nucleic acid-binding protein
MSIYIDTSALTKRYVSEATSARFDAFVDDSEAVLHVTPLTVTEFHSMLMRRLRMGDLDEPYLEQARQQFSADLQSQLWIWSPLPAAAFGLASTLIQDLGVPLSTLDALHLATARLFECTGFATADLRLARAASQCGLAVHDFAPGSANL